MAKPRLLFISSLFPDTREPYRGIDNATLLHHLADRWDIAVIALRPILPFARKGWRPQTKDELFFPRYVPAHYLPKIGHSRNHRIMAGSLRSHIGELRGAFQVALAAWTYPDCSAIALLSEEFGFPFVAIAQGTDVHQDLQIPARRRIISELLPRASGIVTRSEEIGRLLADSGISRGRLHTILNGTDFDRFQPAEVVTVREELGLPVNQRIVLFVGDFVPAKNPVLLVEAFRRLCGDDRFANALLVLVGGGPLEGEINFHAERGGRAGRVLLAGRQAPDRVGKFMQAADVLCVPSNDEGVPNVILEAFACGVPVVATQVGGIPEVHQGEYLGRLVAPRDLRALADGLKATLDALPDRKRIHQYARQFTWERAADQYHALLTKAARP